MAALEKRSITIGTAALLSVSVALISIAVTWGATKQKVADDITATATAVAEQKSRIDSHQVLLDRHTGEIYRLDKELDRTKDAAAVTNKRLDELLEEVRATRADVQRAVWRGK